MPDQPASQSDAYPARQYTAKELRSIADLIDALDKADPAEFGDQPMSEVFIKGAVRLSNRDEEDMGSIADLDGLGYFWTPASSDSSQPS